MTNKTIVFVHGLHENAHSWTDWKSFFEDLGYICYTPNYPFHEGIASTLRQNPNKNLAKMRLNDVVEHHTKFIEQLGSVVPILIDHSMGGLIVQKLIQAKKGSLGICITSALHKGVLSFK